MTNRFTVLRASRLITVASLVVGCAVDRSPAWTLAIWNDADQQVVVRVSADSDQRSWLVPVGDAFVAIEAPNPPTGTVELLDPRTCDVLDERELPAIPSIVSPIVDASSPSGLSLAIMLNDRITTSEVRTPNFSGCTG